MNINFSVKRLGKKRAYIDKTPIEILVETKISLAHLLEKIVEHQVAEFNKKRTEKSLFTFFSEKEIDDKTTSGKVDFGAIYNNDLADLIKAKETVKLAFIDGLLAVFIDDQQKENLDEQLELAEGVSITFIRLTFLAGSIW